MKRIFLVAIIAIIGMMAINNQEAKAEISREYKVRVTLFECKCGKPTCLGNIRSEVWSDVFDNVVYSEIRDCQGNTTTTGNKPLSVIGSGSNGSSDNYGNIMWEQARKFSDMYAISIAEAFSSYVFAHTRIDSGENEILDPLTGDTTHVIWQEYIFNFPEEWWSLNASSTLIANSALLPSPWGWDNMVVFSDQIVEARIVNLATGDYIGNFIVVDQYCPSCQAYSNWQTEYVSNPIDNTLLASGCKYGVVIFQDFGNGPVSIRMHPFCKN